MPEEPDKAPASLPTPDPATEPTPATAKKEAPLGVVGWVLATLAVLVVVVVFPCGPSLIFFLYSALDVVSAGRPWLYWVGLPAVALLCLLGWMFGWLVRSLDKDEKDKK